MNKRKKSLLLVILWLVFITINNVIYVTMQDHEWFVYIVFFVSLLCLGEDIIEWAEKQLDK